MCEDEQVGGAMKALGNLHSIKIAPGKYRFATKAAYVNFAGGAPFPLLFPTHSVSCDFSSPTFPPRPLTQPPFRAIPACPTHISIITYKPFTHPHPPSPLPPLPQPLPQPQAPSPPSPLPGDKSRILALNGSSPEWNRSTPITVMEQDLAFARSAAAWPIAAALASEVAAPAVHAGLGLQSKSAARASKASSAPCIAQPVAEAKKRNADGDAEPAVKRAALAGRALPGAVSSQASPGAVSRALPGAVIKASPGAVSKAAAAQPVVRAQEAAVGLMSVNKRRAMEEEGRAKQMGAAAAAAAAAQKAARKQVASPGAAAGGLMSASQRRAMEAASAQAGGLLSASRKRALEAGSGVAGGLVSASKRRAMFPGEEGGGGGEDQEKAMREAMLAQVMSPARVAGA